MSQDAKLYPCFFQNLFSLSKYNGSLQNKRGVFGRTSSVSAEWHIKRKSFSSRLRIIFKKIFFRHAIAPTRPWMDENSRFSGQSFRNTSNSLEAIQIPNGSLNLLISGKQKITLEKTNCRKINSPGCHEFSKKIRK